MTQPAAQAPLSNFMPSRGSVSEQIRAFGKLDRVDLTCGITSLKNRQGSVVRRMGFSMRVRSCRTAPGGK